MSRLLLLLALVAIIVIAVVAGLYFVNKLVNRESFASPRAKMISAVAAEAFADGKNPSFSAVRRPLASVGGLDPVEFDDVRQLARRGKVTPEDVQSVLAAK